MVEKPPLGLRPRWIVVEQRINEIKQALHNYLDTPKYPIPHEWIEEYNQLVTNTTNMKKVTVDDNWLPDGYIQNGVEVSASEDISEDVLEVTYKVRFIRQSSITQAKKSQKYKQEGKS